MAVAASSLLGQPLSRLVTLTTPPETTKNSQINRLLPDGAQAPLVNHEVPVRRKDIQSFSELTGIYEFKYLILLSSLAVFGGGKLALDSLIRQLRAPKESADGIKARVQELPKAA